MTLLRSLVLSTCLLSLGQARAQEAASAQENHPTVKVVKEYLKFMLEQNWKASAQIVEPKSLEDLRDDYVKRVKSTATLEDEKMVVEKFKVNQLEDIDKMTGADFYIAYHQLLKERNPVDDDVIKRVHDSMKLRVLSVAPETDALVHVLVRTKHNNDKVTIESLEVISLVKVGDKWMVGLNEQTPKVTPLAAVKPAATAATESAPAVTPEPPAAPKPEVPKPTAKPSVKPKSK